MWVGELEIALTGGKLKNNDARVPGENFCGVIVGRGLEVNRKEIISVNFFPVIISNFFDLTFLKQKQ